MSGDFLWASDVSGDFSDPTKWTGGVAPNGEDHAYGDGDQAFLNADGGAPYTVTMNGVTALKSIQTSSNVTLDLSDLTVVRLTNGGALNVENGGQLAFEPDGAPNHIQNTGTIALEIGSSVSLGSGVILSGGGTVMLNSASSAITGGLTNVDNTIEGAGSVGGLLNESKGVVDADDPKFALGLQNVTNQGLLEATAFGGLSLFDITNEHLIEATGAGRLFLGGLIENAGGTISAAADARVQMDGADILGGKFTGAGQLEFVSSIGNILDGTSSPVDLAIAHSVVGPFVVLTGEGTIDSAGVFRVNGSATLLGTLDNTGTLVTDGVDMPGKLTVKGAVTGDGKAVIDGGRLAFDSAFSQDVRFTSHGGELVLADAFGHEYGATISGFSTTGATKLELSGIAFESKTEATFSGAKSGGVLTVVGANGTAHIDLEGDYLGVTFIASSALGGAASVIRAAIPPAAAAHPAATAAPVHASGESSHAAPGGEWQFAGAGDHPAASFPIEHAAGSLLIGDSPSGVTPSPVVSLGDWLFH